MSVIHAPRKPELEIRVLAFPIAMAVLLSLLFLRLWYIQVVRAPELTEKAKATQSTTIKRLAPRGLMYDRTNRLVAGVRPEVVITAVPSVVLDNEWVLDELGSMLETDPKKLLAKVKDSSFRPHLAAPIFVGADIETGTKIAEASEDLPGIGVETQPMRNYPDSRSFTHVLGYVWTPNEKDVKRLQELNLEIPDYVGKAGLEKAYEAELMGSPGLERLEVDAKRRPLKVAGRDAATAGNQLVLTLDARLQRFATQLFTEKKFLGGVVALDPKSGEVLCLVSSPTFDQNLFSGGITDTEWKLLSEDERKPMWNRALYSAYAPGSTFKIVTTIAAMQKGIFNPNATYHCAGGVRLGRSFFGCLGRHGSISFHRAMTKSCNSYFYQLGRAAGEDALRKASLDVGLGAVTGLEIGGESKGIVPTDEWIKKWRADGKWYGGDTMNFSIGQGFLSTTPIQMANVAALVANNGVSYRPHLVREIKDARGIETVKFVEPSILNHVEASPAFWQGMRSSLVNVLEEGTAKVARIPGTLWGGKTGSAEHRQGAKTHGWFVGFAPADDPQIAICVLVEAAGHGGDVAAPIARDIVKKYLDLQSADRNSPAASSAPAAPAGSPAAR